VAGRERRGPQLRLVNQSGFVTRDLYRYCLAAVRYYRVRGPIVIVVSPSPIRSRGCAEVGGTRVRVAIAAPSHQSEAEFRRRLANLLRHELGHKRGLTHDDMGRRGDRGALLYSLGDEPPWSRGRPLRREGRAPSRWGRPVVDVDERPAWARKV
jgi:hypothetical protein